MIGRDIGMDEFEAWDRGEPRDPYYREPKPTCNVYLCEADPHPGCESCLMHELDGWIVAAIAAHDDCDDEAYDEAMWHITDLGAVDDLGIRRVH